MSKHSGDESIKISKSAIWQIVSGILFVLLVVSIFTSGFGIKAAPNGSNNGGNNGGNTGGSGTGSMELFADDVVLGSKDAKVTIIEYSDPSCPFCAAAAGGEKMVAYMTQRYPGYQAAVPNIIKDYVDTGKAKLVFRFFPGHGTGEDAMKIMLCANEQGKFWEVHDALFDNQDSMESGDTAKLKQVAVAEGLDSAKLDTCLSSGKYNSKLSTDTLRGQQAGIRGTPGFLINGQIISGADTYPNFRTVIEAALTA